MGHAPLQPHSNFSFYFANRYAILRYYQVLSYLKEPIDFRQKMVIIILTCREKLKQETATSPRRTIEFGEGFFSIHTARRSTRGSGLRTDVKVNPCLPCQQNCPKYGTLVQRCFLSKVFLVITVTDRAYLQKWYLPHCSFVSILTAFKKFPRWSGTCSVCSPDGNRLLFLYPHKSTPAGSWSRESSLERSKPFWERQPSQLYTKILKGKNKFTAGKTPDSHQIEGPLTIAVTKTMEERRRPSEQIMDGALLLITWAKFLPAREPTKFNEHEPLNIKTGDCFLGQRRTNP